MPSSKKKKKSRRDKYSAVAPPFKKPPYDHGSSGAGIERELHDPSQDKLSPVFPLDLSRCKSIDALVRAMADTAFTGRQLGEATDVLESSALLGGFQQPRRERHRIEFVHDASDFADVRGV